MYLSFLKNLPRRHEGTKLGLFLKNLPQRHEDTKLGKLFFSPLCLCAFLAKKQNLVLLCGALLIFQGFSTRDSPAKENEIRKAFHKGVHFLQAIQREDGAICDTVNPLFDTWETILAATSLFEIYRDTSDPVFKKAITYLKLNEDDTGLICHNKKCREAYCLETTAVYFLLLLKIGEKEVVRQRMDTILALQRPAGDWEIGNPDVREFKNFPSVTAFVLTLLSDLKMPALYQEAALDWLQKCQTPEGHWGYTWEYYDCPAYALWPVMKVLQDQDTPGLVAARKKALSYILSQQQEDGSWEFTGTGLQKRPSKALQTALMLSALEAAGRREYEGAIEKGIDYLLANQQENGAWNGGYFPIDNTRYEKKEYIFATARTLSVLNTYLLYQATGK